MKSKKSANSGKTQVKQLSQQLLEKARTGENLDKVKQKIATLERQELSKALETDEEKKAFWLNIYNAYIQILLKQKPSRFDRKFIFFHRRFVKVAGKALSLEKVEHGLLRGSKLSFSFGYFRNPFAGFFERKFRVQEVDPRIHFALNCGAKTCPPVKFYESERLDEQLEKASGSYLNQEVIVEEGLIRVPRVFLWFRGDFGGKKGIREFLEGHGFETGGKSIKYREWDWEMDLDDFEEQEER